MSTALHADNDTNFLINSSQIARILKKQVEYYLKTKEHLPLEHSIMAQITAEAYLLEIPYYFEIQIVINYKDVRKKVKFVTSSMLLNDFLRAGFLHYIFKSKYFWGYDPILWRLGKYKTKINLFITQEQASTNAILKHKSRFKKKAYLLLTNSKGERMVTKINIFNKVLWLYAKNWQMHSKIYKICEIKF